MTQVVVNMDSTGLGKYAEMIERVLGGSSGRPNITIAEVEGRESMCESILKRGV